MFLNFSEKVFLWLLWSCGWRWFILCVSFFVFLLYFSISIYNCRFSFFIFSRIFFGFSFITISWGRTTFNCFFRCRCSLLIYSWCCLYWLFLLCYVCHY